ncbi:MAG: AAA family ATPase [Polyangia bacterium]
MNKNAKKNKGKQGTWQGRSVAQTQAAASSAPIAVATEPSLPALPPLSEQAKGLHAEAVSAAPGEGAGDGEGSHAAGASSVEASEALRLALDARERFRAAEKEQQALLAELQVNRARLEEEISRHNDEVKKHEAAEKELRGKREEHERSAQALDAAMRSHDAEVKKLLERESTVSQRERAAEAGFLREQRQALVQMEEEASALRKQISLLKQEHASEAAAFYERLRADEQAWQRQQSAEHEQLRSELVAAREAHRLEIQAEYTKRTQALAEEESTQRARLAAERNDLDAQRTQIDAERRSLKRELGQIKAEQQILGEDKQDLERLVAQRAAREIELRDGRIRELSERLDVSREERESLARQLQQRAEAERRFGARTPEDVLRELDELKADCERLKGQLAARPSEDAAQRLEELVVEKERWQRERHVLEQECTQLRHSLDKCQIGVVQLETLRDHKIALETSRKLLQDRLHELQEQVDSRLRETEGRSPFPACAAMDRDPKLQARSPNEERSINLGEFVIDLQQRLVSALSERRLYYSLADVRCFVAGLAMSRLHILQGISGTGKTSLPLAFANAIGAHSTVIRVQSSWRDRQDLIGHYNTFERRFHESEFLQALYLAQCPQNEGRPVLVVLDEMNLSHPEHYFADLLSLLEEPAEKQLLDLMDAPIPSAPAKLVDGRLLRLSRNVWFIGTANHDETTKGFADKTYDRAHVMELPRKPKEFISVEPQQRRPIGLDDLMHAFKRAKKQHKDVVQEGFQVITSELGAMLERDFRIGWGNRLERQADDFASVVMDAGGTLAEALDHLLATKVLRKVRDRHDTRPDDLERLKQQLEKAWTKAKLTAVPVKSSALLESEMRRLGRGDE